MKEAQQRQFSPSFVLLQLLRTFCACISPLFAMQGGGKFHPVIRMKMTWIATMLPICCLLK
jgi:hypothetical protein